MQQLQRAPDYVDFYSGSLLDGRFDHPPQSQLPGISHSHPDPAPIWDGPRGFGARHINDCAPFSLWSQEKQDFRPSTREEERWILNEYQADRVEFRGHLIIIETSNLPKPVPLTVGCIPTIFVPIGQRQKFMCGETAYATPRVADSCPHWPLKRMQNPTTLQMVNIIEALTNLMNVRRVNFLPWSMVVELEHGDGRTYESATLPGVVAGFTTTYHHDSIPFFDAMRDRTRERLLDPSQYIPGPPTGPLPQDGANYLREPSWGTLNPGVRVSTGYASDSGMYADSVQSTTCGIRLKKGTTEYVTVANHGFLRSDEVFHPGPDDDKIGDIVDRYPELDVAMVRLTPAHWGRFSNEAYFLAEPPKRLVGKGDLVLGAWLEVDGMSSGLISLSYQGSAMEKPERPPGHPKIPVLHWRRNSIMRVFGASNGEVMDGLCGAPIVEVMNGNVAGFFHKAGGDWAECAALDDLIAEGWEVV